MIPQRIQWTILWKIQSNRAEDTYNGRVGTAGDGIIKVSRRLSHRRVTVSQDKMSGVTAGPSQPPLNMHGMLPAVTCRDLLVTAGPKHGRRVAALRDGLEPAPLRDSKVPDYSGRRLYDFCATSAGIFFGVSGALAKPDRTGGH